MAEGEMQYVGGWMLLFHVMNSDKVGNLEQDHFEENRFDYAD
jgi:hypothetical protein